MDLSFLQAQGAAKISGQAVRSTVSTLAQCLAALGIGAEKPEVALGDFLAILDGQKGTGSPIEVELAYKVSLASLSQINAKPLFPSPLRRRGLLPARWTPHSAGSGRFSNSTGPAGAERRVPPGRFVEARGAERQQRSGSAPAPDRQDGRIRHDACRHARLHRRSRHHTPTGYR